MALNLKALFFLTQALAPICAPQQPAVTTWPRSSTSRPSTPSASTRKNYSYHASKAGLMHLTKRMALQLIGDGIVMNGIVPGGFASNMNKLARDHADELGASIPSGRIGNAEDMAAAAIYLASRAGDYVVGTMITLDGGYSYSR